MAPSKNEEASQKKKAGGLRPFVENECKVLGYILLSKPQTVISIEPVTVGCVFYSANVHKYFLRVKRITFTVQYLQNFVNLDPTTN